MRLEIGVILPSFHAEGKVPVEIERLNNLHNDGAMLRDVDFIILGEIPSVPVDLDTSSPAKSSRTDSSVQRRSAGQLLGPREPYVKSGS